MDRPPFLPAPKYYHPPRPLSDVVTCSVRSSENMSVTELACPVLRSGVLLPCPVLRWGMLLPDGTTWIASRRLVSSDHTLAQYRTSHSTICYLRWLVLPEVMLLQAMLLADACAERCPRATLLCCAAQLLRMRYAMSGTELGYAATRQAWRARRHQGSDPYFTMRAVLNERMQCPVPTSPMLQRLLCGVRSWDAVCGTEMCSTPAPLQDEVRC
eukprot:2713116-Rhodomonas_salina.4